MIVIKIRDLAGLGDCKLDGYDDKNWFIADSFSFGVEREMKESGEKGGSEDLNIGVGELQECTVSKSMDRGSTLLAQSAINGNSLGPAQIHFVETAGGGGIEGSPFCYLKYNLARVFVKSWSTSGDADDRPTEEIAFYYNKIAFNYASSPDGKKFEPCKEMSWNNVTNKKWNGHAIGSPDPAKGFTAADPSEGG